MSLNRGARLGPYEVLGSLGAGGMGEVYRARDPRLGRDVAIKVIRADPEPGADRRRRFEDEARAAGALNHPNVLSVLDVGTAEGQPYVVFELLEGETLADRGLDTTGNSTGNAESLDELARRHYRRRQARATRARHVTLGHASPGPRVGPRRSHRHGLFVCREA